MSDSLRLARAADGPSDDRWPDLLYPAEHRDDYDRLRRIAKAEKIANLKAELAALETP